MNRRLLCAVLIIGYATDVAAQAQMKSSPDVQINIENPSHEKSIPTVNIGDVNHLYKVGILAPSGCDKNAVLLDVLTNIADATFVKAELDYETNNKLDPSAVYKRRLQVIKTMVGKE